MSTARSAHLDTFARDALPARELWPTIEFTIDDVQYPEQLNAAHELIDKAVMTHGADRVCLRTPAGAVWSYGEILAGANRIAHVLEQDMGLVAGNRVILRGPNSPWIAMCWLGVLKAGGIAILTMHALRATELAPIIEATDAQFAICDDRFADDLRAATTETFKAENIITFAATDTAVVTDTADATGAGAVTNTGDLARKMATKPVEHDDVKTFADDVALLAPTSGTTGKPKITVHFHRDILANADTFARHILKPTADDVFIGSPPLAFTFGLGGLLVFPLRFGSSSILVERATPVDLAALVEENQASILFTAPTAYRAIIRENKAHQLNGLRKAVSAGETLPESVWHEVEQATGLQLIDGIGSTELLHIFISARDNDIRPGSTGKPIPGYRATILDDDGNELPAGELGQLGVIGPTGCRYLHGDRQENYVLSGWNVTGDIFKKDEDGYFWFSARNDSMIVSSGYNIGAPEVEEALGLHPDVVESAVIGKPDKDRGAIVVAFIVLRSSASSDDAKRKEIQDFMKQTIAPYKYPREINFVDSLPRNPSGKLQHFRLRDQVSA